MEFTINTETKVIVLKQMVDLDELYTWLQEHFPNDWKEYKLGMEVLPPQEIYPTSPYPWSPVTPQGPWYTGDPYPPFFTTCEDIKIYNSDTAGPTYPKKFVD